MSDQVLISIVNWNGRELLGNCLKSLYETTEYPNFDVVVVDNGSVDGSLEFLADTYPKVQVIENDDNRGFSKAHNQSIRLALKGDYDYVLLLNNDVILIEPGWLGMLVEMMESDEKLGVGGCRVDEPDGSVHYNGRYFPLSSVLFPGLKRQYNYNRIEKDNKRNHTYVDDVTGALFMIRCSTINNVGLLDESYSPAYYEESDYCVRVWDNGYRVGFTDKTRVVHSRQETADRLDPVWLGSLIHRNRLRFVLTNYPLSWILLGLPMLVFRTAEIVIDVSEGNARVKEGTFRHPLRTLACLMKPYVSTVQHAPQIIRKRSDRSDVKTLLK